jgi:hypothetical protein
LNSLGTPVAGQFAFLSDSAALVYFNGTVWKKIMHDAVLQYSASNAPSVFSTVSIPDSPANTSSLLKLGGGLVSLPAFTASEMLSIENLAPGMLVYDQTGDVIRYYNGNDWVVLAAVSTTIPVSPDAPALVPGIAINQSTKHPSSVMDIHASGGKAFMMPMLNPDQIYNPVAGLICFNPTNNKLMIYDGLRWNLLK